MAHNLETLDHLLSLLLEATHIRRGTRKGNRLCYFGALNVRTGDWVPSTYVSCTDIEAVFGGTLM
jgi:hypothetical protein